MKTEEIKVKIEIPLDAFFTSILWEAVSLLCKEAADEGEEEQGYFEIITSVGDDLLRIVKEKVNRSVKLSVPVELTLIDCLAIEYTISDEVFLSYDGLNGVTKCRVITRKPFAPPPPQKTQAD